MRLLLSSTSMWVQTLNPLGKYRYICLQTIFSKCKLAIWSLPNLFWYWRTPPASGRPPAASGRPPPASGGPPAAGGGALEMDLFEAHLCLMMGYDSRNT